AGLLDARDDGVERAGVAEDRGGGVAHAADDLGEPVGGERVQDDDRGARADLLAQLADRGDLAGADLAERHAVGVYAVGLRDADIEGRQRGRDEQRGRAAGGDRDGGGPVTARFGGV